MPVVDPVPSVPQNVSFPATDIHVTPVPTTVYHPFITEYLAAVRLYGARSAEAMAVD